MGEEANIFKARYLYGNGGRRCGRYKCEGPVSYPGRSDMLPEVEAMVTGRLSEGVSEVSRSHINFVTAKRRAEHNRT